jgi:squalene-associated FAD-dependent desaturase
VKSKLAVVVGGGFAGLSAATALAEAGVPVQVVEARPSLGGRANAFREPMTGERIDNGQHILVGCYTETLRFLARIGSVPLLHRPSTLSVPMIDEDGRQSELTLPPLPAPLNLIAGVFAWEALTSVDRWSILRVGRAVCGHTPVRPDETVRQWLQRHRQPARLCRLFWEPLALAALNQSIDEVAASAFATVTSRMFGGDAQAATLLLPAVPLDELYVLPSRQYLERAGSRVMTHAKAKVVFGRDGVHAVKAGDAITPAAVVICAVPWFALADALESPPGILARLVANATAMRSVPIVTVNLWFENYAPQQPLVGLPGRTFQWMFARRALVGPRQSHLSLVSSGADAISRTPSEELIATAARELRAAIPDLRDMPVRHGQVVRERRATFSLHPSAPTRPGTVTPVAGLFLAGDWIDTGLPATIESAVESGHRAAAEALKLLH